MPKPTKIVRTRAVGFLSLFIGLAALFLPHSVQAQTSESISSFDSVVTVAKDGGVHVQETVVYDPGGSPHHGIYRTIHETSAYGTPINIANVGVADENGNPYAFQISNDGTDETIKIGDPNATFTDPHTYVIDYDVAGALGSFKDFDEIYWNATGNEWTFPIDTASVTFALPTGISPVQASCYSGPSGSTASCGDLKSATINDDGSVEFDLSGALSPGEGLTAAVGFPKGSVIIPPPPKVSPTALFFKTYGGWLNFAVFLLLPLIAFLILLKKKRSAPGPRKGTIIPEYDAPDGLTPLQMTCLLHTFASSDAVFAEMIDLAVRGWLSITKIKSSGFMGKLRMAGYDYRFTLLKPLDGAGALPDSDQRLLRGLFGGTASIESKLEDIYKDPSLAGVPSDPTAGLSSVTLTDLRMSFASTMEEIREAALLELVQKGYYNGNPRKSAIKYTIPGILTMFLSFFIAGFGTVLLQFIGPVGWVFSALLWGLIPTGIVMIVFGLLSSAYNEKGMRCHDAILGFKEYLQIAEKDRINFADAPEKNPTTFEKFLPYAMALGVEKAWGNEFEGVYTTNPPWYGDTTGSTRAFGAIGLSQEMTSFGATASASFSSGGSGSSGGGSSGGGGGGGGGGSW
jgi:uncharacterized membrane protein YgcG